MKLMKNEDRLIGDIIAPFTKDGKFVQDFWMENRLGAMVGASTSDYEKANMRHGMLGSQMRHNYIVTGNEVNKMTTAGDNGWNPDGAEYRWVKGASEAANRKYWMNSGCPTKNRYGEWGPGGYPMAYVIESNKNPINRDLSQFCAEYGLGCPQKHRKHRD